MFQAVKPVNACLRNYAGETALHLAALRCSLLTVFTSLLKLSRLDVAKDTILQFNAIKNPNSTVRMKLARKLLEHHTQSRLLVNKRGETLLYLAINQGAIDVAEYLLKSKKLDVNGKPGRKVPLIIALVNGDESAVKLLLSQNARADLADSRVYPLHAAMTGFRHNNEVLLRVCKSLLDRGTPLDQFDLDKYTVLHDALLLGKPDVADLLIDRGANVHLKTPAGQSLLHIASEKGLINIAKKLLVAGADANDITCTGASVLEYATYSDSKELVQLLLEYGADCRTDGGAFVSALTIHNKNLEILKLFLSKGADVNVKVRGKMPLAHAFGIHGTPKISGYVRGYLLKHMALLASQGQPLHTENLELIDKYEAIKAFYEKCVGELELMRSKVVCKESPVTYYDLLTKRHDSLVRCLHCQKLRHAVKSGAGKDTLSFYYSSMGSNYYVGLRRLSMLQKLRELLQEVLGKQLLCELIEVICQYFSDKELEAITSFRA